MDKDIFCKIVDGEMESNICFENEDIISIMDAYPSSPGHILIIPKKHYTSILEMDDETNSKILEVAKIMMKKIESLYPNVTGIKVVVNYGDEQIVKHYHMHLLPIYEDDKEPSFSQKEFCDLLTK